MHQEFSDCFQYYVHNLQATEIKSSMAINLCTRRTINSCSRTEATHMYTSQVFRIVQNSPRSMTLSSDIRKLKNSPQIQSLDESVQPIWVDRHITAQSYSPCISLYIHVWIASPGFAGSKFQRSTIRCRCSFPLNPKRAELRQRLFTTEVAIASI